MSRGLYRTLERRERGIWVVKRMCEEHELYRAYGANRDLARANFKMLTASLNTGSRRTRSVKSTADAATN